MKGKENQGMIFFLSILLAKILKHPFSHHVYFKENYKMKKREKKKNAWRSREKTQLLHHRRWLKISVWSILSN